MINVEKIGIYVSIMHTRLKIMFCFVPFQCIIRISGILQVLVRIIMNQLYTGDGSFADKRTVPALYAPSSEVCVFREQKFHGLADRIVGHGELLVSYGDR